MAINLRGRSLTKLFDLNPSEVNYLLRLSHELKAQRESGVKNPVLPYKNIALIFQKDSTRTRCSFENAAKELGMHTVYLGPSGSQLGKKESIVDTAQVLGRLFDGIEFRGFLQSDVESLARHSGVPVWNGLTDDFHPTQILADFLTIQERHHNQLEGVKLVFVGDARNNMGRSLMVGAAMMGMHFVALAPKSLWPSDEIVAKCQKIARQTKGKIEFSTDKFSAVKGAHVIYTDVWVSMGEHDWSERLTLLQDYQVNMELIKHAREDVIFMHCLPSFHDTNTIIGSEVAKKYGSRFPFLKNGEIEVTNEVFTSKHSVVFDQAENRLHTIKAIILATIGY